MSVSFGLKKEETSKLKNSHDMDVFENIVTLFVMEHLISIFKEAFNFWPPEPVAHK